MMVHEFKSMEARRHVQNRRAFLAEGVGCIGVAIIVQENRFFPIENREECARSGIRAEYLVPGEVASVLDRDAGRSVQRNGEDGVRAVVEAAADGAGNVGVDLPRGIRTGQPSAFWQSQAFCQMGGGVQNSGVGIQVSRRGDVRFLRVGCGIGETAQDDNRRGTQNGAEE